MRKLALLLLLCANSGLAQQGVIPADAKVSALGQPRPAVREATVPLGYRYVASYKDLYCAGFATHERFAPGNMVAGGRSSPEQTRFGIHEMVFLAGSGYEPGRKYAVIRDVRDRNRYEFYAGQNKALDRLGRLYAEIGQVTVTLIENGYAVATVDQACEPLVPGDTIIPIRDKGTLVIEPRSSPFPVYGIPLPPRHGRIIMASDFDYFVGTRKAVYINLGSKAGLGPGNYLRISRSYNPDSMPESTRISLSAPQWDDTQRKPMKPSPAMMKHWPLRGVGELVVISVTPDSATCLVSMALEDVQVGDYVAPEKER